MNQIIHGDVLDVLRSLPAELTFDCVIADPPYNHGIWRNEPVADYAAWCEEWLLECMARLRPGGLLYCYGWPEYLAHVAVRFPVKRQRWLQWFYRGKVAPGSQFFQRGHESVLCLWPDNVKGLPTIIIDQCRVDYALSSHILEERGQHRGTRSRFGSEDTLVSLHPDGARPRDWVFSPYMFGALAASERSFICCGEVHPPSAAKTHRDHDRIYHPTQKPAKLTRYLLRAILRDGVPGDVLVPFAGSGSECRVAQSMSHRYLGIELDEQWVRLARETLAATEQML